MKKAIWTLLIASFLTITLTGCKGKTKTNSDKPEDNVPVESGEDVTPGGDDTPVTPDPVVVKYTVKWMNGDTLLLEEKYKEGEIPLYKGAIPTKESTAQFSYTFNGWDRTPEAIHSDTTYYAQFEETVKQYTVTWVLLTSQVVEQYDYGQIPVYPNGIPQEPSTVEYDYTFLNWQEEIVPVTGNTYYHARFNITTRSYMIRFIVEGVEVYNANFPYGTVPVYGGPTPTKDGDVQYSYKFVGWDKELDIVTGEATYTAVFEQNVNSYLVKFVDEDDTVLYQQTFEYGQTPSYQGETPTKDPTVSEVYTFYHWDLEASPVTKDCAYTAVWLVTPRQYVINFLNGEDVLQSSEYAYGSTPSYSGATPTKLSTDQYDYTFSGWDKEISQVTGEETYVAQFEATVRKYEITFAFENHTYKYDVEYGKLPEFKGEIEEKAADAQYSYTFNGWDKEIVPVTGATTYTATYSSSLNSYLVKFVDENSNILYQNSFEYGQVPTYDGETPTKASTVDKDFTFSGWDKALAEVTGEQTYVAQFNESVRKYTVRFENYNGDLLETKQVPYDSVPAYEGSTPNKPSDVQYDYTFSGWDKALEGIKGDTTYVAEFNGTLRQYNIRFVNHDGSELQSGLVTYGQTPSYSGETPTKASDAQYNYTFNGWDEEISAVNGEKTYTAQYAQQLRKYTVTFKDNNDNVLQSTLVDYGATPVYEGEQTFSFDTYMDAKIIGWDKELAPVTGDAVYVAQVKKVSKVDCFTYQDIDDTTCKITGFGPLAAIGMTEIVFPEKYNGKTIVEIGQDSLAGTSPIGYQLKEITIPSNIKTIGNASFQGDGITKLVLEEGVERIEGYAFYEANITELVIPSTLTYIGPFAFYSTSIVDLFIPATVLNIESCAFYSTSTNFYCEAEEKPDGWALQWKYSNSGIVYWGFDKDAKRITIDDLAYFVINNEAVAFKYTGSAATVVIADTVEIDSVEYPVVKIAPEAFYDNDNLINLTLGDNVVEISDSAFRDCSNLVSVDLANVETIGYMAFYDCDSIEVLNIPDTVETIGDYAFFRCTSVTAINGMNGIQNIGRMAFHAMDSLVYIYLPASMLTLSENIGDCRDSGFVILAEPATRPSTWNYNTYYIIFNCPQGTKAYLVGDVSYLITSENTVMALRYKGTGPNFTIPSTVEIEGHTYNVTTMYNYFLGYQNKNLVTAVNIAGSIATITDDSIRDSQSILTVTFNEGTTRIEGGAMWGLGAITDMYLPHSLEYLGDNFISNSSDTTVHYNGTMAEWETLIANSDSYWNINGVVKSVVCTDGVIDLTNP